MPDVEDLTDDRQWAAARARDMLVAGGTTPPRPRLIGVMVASVDARAALDGKSGGLSSEPDKALLKAWRAVADAVLVGARTLETERYGSLIPDADRDARLAAGRPGWPRLLTISRRLDIDFAKTLSTDPDLPLTVYTEADATDGDRAHGSDVEIVTLPDVAPANVVADARDRYGAQVIACEGGPHLLAAALRAGVLTDLSITVAPAIGGEGPPLIPDSGRAAPIALELRDAEARAGSIFAHYTVTPGAS
ncbi:hypothetical protein DSM112329_04491 [Paraconexibacter sp. AEG42_29]|uniref:Bacterial bifunctional deaminase-reductase C-terminal domain-containing protein n=1 Tax=Paraconexibacter sp. AEG42_29 TaxID=2997339 RepID=A0AAU7B127_9ACTN